jgi:hypothetical protein
MIPSWRTLILDELFDLSLYQALREVTEKEALGRSEGRRLCG